MKGKTKRIIVTSIIIIIISLFLWNKNRVEQPRIKKIAIIPHGKGIAEIAKILKNEGIIENEWNFILLAKYYETNIKAGEYEIYTLTPLRELLDILGKGGILEHKITIPEGYNIYQIGKLLENNGICNSESFVKAAFLPDLIYSLGIDGISVEGYLFPDTYYFRKGTPAEYVVKKMVSHFNKIYLIKYAPIEEKKGLN